MEKRTTHLIALVLFLFSGWNAPLFAQANSAGKLILVELPDPCYLLEKAEGNRIYLKSIPNPCGKGMKALPVELKSDFTGIEIYTDGKLWKKSEAKGAWDIDRLNELGSQVAAQLKELKIPVNPHAKEGKKEAGRLMEYFRSEAYQRKLAEEQERIKSTLFKDHLTAELKSSEPALSPSYLTDNERIYLFISSSIPMSALKAYARDLDRLKDPRIVVVMRGFVGEMKKLEPTMKFTSALLSKEDSCDVRKKRCPAFNINLEVDPTLFKKYQIIRVPALVYAGNLTPAEKVEQPSETAAGEASFYMSEGDAPFPFLLEKINHDAKSASLKKILDLLKED